MTSGGRGRAHELFRRRWELSFFLRACVLPSRGPMISRRARVVFCNTHHLQRRVTRAPLTTRLETLPAGTYMYLLGLSSKSLAYLACLPWVSLAIVMIGNPSVPPNNRLLEQGGSMLHAAAWHGDKNPVCGRAQRRYLRASCMNACESLHASCLPCIF
jgi:hypothetical protein